MKTNPHESGDLPIPVSPLRALRDYLGLRMGHRITAEQLALLGGRSPSLVRNVECGISKMSDKLAKVYERRFDVPAAWLLQDSVEKGAVPPTRAGGEIVAGIPVDPFAEASNGAAEDLVFLALRRKLKSCVGVDYLNLLNALAVMASPGCEEDTDE